MVGALDRCGLCRSNVCTVWWTCDGTIIVSREGCPSDVNVSRYCVAKHRLMSTFCNELIILYANVFLWSLTLYQ
jgi:hypothetical protein